MAQNPHQQHPQRGIQGKFIERERAQKTSKSETTADRAGFFTESEHTGIYIYKTKERNRDRYIEEAAAAAACSAAAAARVIREQTEKPINHPVTSHEPRRSLSPRISQ